ncbi:hypothetical protein [Streptomyces sp. NRRL S-350]|uniref:hypothetical protein n=1 Tax=Streptomyces sp. NRRL S-350 TaxID=1463902 RepID=UPI00131E435C|nr:hypothetical protein [Streptomyces sp. NRRL S-350]
MNRPTAPAGGTGTPARPDALPPRLAGDAEVVAFFAWAADLDATGPADNELFMTTRS